MFLAVQGRYHDAFNALRGVELGGDEKSPKILDPLSITFRRFACPKSTPGATIGQPVSFPIGQLSRSQCMARQVIAWQIPPVENSTAPSYPKIFQPSPIRHLQGVGNTFEVWSAAEGVANSLVISPLSTAEAQ